MTKKREFIIYSKMDLIGGTLCILFVILARLDQCYAMMECKNGSIAHFEGHPIDEHNVGNAMCQAENRYCAAVICTRIGLSFIFWTCAFHNNKTHCADVYTMNMRNKPGGEDIICDCKFGAIGEELANEQFLLPELPTGRVKCMFGSFTEKGYGRTRVQEFKKEFQFCYMATCASENNGALMMWGCSENENCTEIAAKESANFGDFLLCQCVFGKKGVEMANEHFTLPMPPPFIIITAVVDDDNSSSLRLAGAINGILPILVGTLTHFHGMFARLLM